MYEKKAPTGTNAENHRRKRSYLQSKLRQQGVSEKRIEAMGGNMRFEHACVQFGLEEAQKLKDENRLIDVLGW